MEKVPEDIPFAIINKSWTDEQRRTIWCLICKARKGLHVELSPIIASAFVILQRYFRNSCDCCYELFILMVAALFTACKAADCFRPIQAVYAEITRICQSAPSMKIRSLLGDRELNTQQNLLINPNDIVQITQAELDLLKSIDFNYEIDTPFTHFERWKQTLKATIPDEDLIRLCNSVIVDICLILCSAFYLDVPPEVAAAAATVESCTDVITTETYDWLKTVHEKYGEEIFNLAVKSIKDEKQKTAFRPPSQMRMQHQRQMQMQQQQMQMQQQQMQMQQQQMQMQQQQMQQQQMQMQQQQMQMQHFQTQHQQMLIPMPAQPIFINENSH